MTTKAERILEARAMIEAGTFKRRIVSRVAETVGYDRVELECGHSTLAMPPLPRLGKDDGRHNCSECAEAWLEQQT